MKKIKKWFIERALPVYARESLLKEVARLERENAELRAENLSQQAYIRGLENGVRSVRRITINNNTGDVKK